MAKCIEYVRKVMSTKSAWVLFSNGTFVVLDKPEEGRSLEEQALEAINKYGQVMAGGPPGDFNVIRTDHGCSVVTGHCPYMYTCVLEDEENGKGMDMMIGLYGRGKRQKDFIEKKVVHIEEQRK